MVQCQKGLIKETKTHQNKITLNVLASYFKQKNRAQNKVPCIAFSLVYCIKSWRSFDVNTSDSDIPYP